MILNTKPIIFVGNFSMMLKGPQIKTNNYLIKQLPEAIVFINKKFEVVYASDKWFKAHELEPGLTFGRKIGSIFSHLSENLEGKFEESFKDDAASSEIEYSLQTAAGDKFFKWTWNPWYDESENVIGLIILTQDITLSKFREERVQRLQSLLEVTAEVGEIGTWEYNVEEDKLLWCDMTRKIHEVSNDFEPSMDNAFDFYKEGYSKNTISLIVHKAMESGEPWSEKLQIITAKGKEIWVQAAGRPIFKNQKLVSLAGTFQNIQDQIQTEVKTKASEDLMRTLINNLPLNVYIKDIDSRKILVNKAECDYFGVNSPEELLGKSDFDLFDEDMAQISRDEDIMVMETLNPMLGKETISRTKDGKVTTFLTSKIPLSHKDGKAYGLVGISLDISDIKRKEDELRDLINVTSLQNKKLVNFAHIVSHNLRSHTSNFSMLLDFLVHEKEEVEKQNIIKMLVNASDNLLETLENLNEVVAINTNVNLKKRPVSLNNKIHVVEQNLIAFLKNNNAKIINKITEELEIKGVPTYVENVLMNFITNAVRYKNPERDPIITLTARREKNYCILSISDNGLGIDLKKYGDKLFGMYKTFHDHPDARGIGLYITKNQIEAMNGKITVSSQLGKGTTFNIYFNETN
ncbi:PAS domain S-box protein [Pareuzebyella sediminis]|uniref:PAS domain S-box protein n=1 Tax=Pareuzebyella sediminis TaxID=2607998 RepID=UPI001E3786DB|nr:PAS domain S-box protein [Pareuzebyella sediminis]